MDGARLRRQDGFIREILWLALILAILAVVVLDGLALFTAHQSVKDDADTAAEEARTEYAQSQDLGAAKLAAEQYLIKANKKFIAFSAATGVDGGLVITVKARAHADTYAFKYLRYVGLKKWVDQMTNPTATARRTSERTRRADGARGRAGQWSVRTGPRAAWRRRPSCTISSTSARPSTPEAAHSRGNPLMAVMPGIVLISLTEHAAVRPRGRSRSARSRCSRWPRRRPRPAPRPRPASRRRCRRGSRRTSCPPCTWPRSRRTRWRG